MRIAIIGSRGYPSRYGGYESFIKELSERLVVNGVEVTVYCHKALFKERPTTLNGINLVYIPAIETKSLSQLSHSFLSIIHACFSPVDILFVVNSANGPFGLIPRLLRKRTVINVDGLEWLRPKWKGLGARYYYFAARMATRFYDKLVTDAEEMRQVYLEEFGCDSKYIAYGAPKVLNDPSADRLQKWGLQPQEYYLIVGRLIPDNNSKMIAEGFLRSATRRRLVILGSVPYRDPYVEELKALAESDSRLLVTGHINDREEVAQFFRNAYMYIHGHEYGGTNPTMLEALGYQCAILALNTRFNREMLQNGKFGAYFEKDTKHIGDAINLWDDRSEAVAAMRRKAPEGITSKYRWETVTAEYLEVFRELYQA